MLVRMTAVIVLFGGDGSEHRVSVASAQNVTSHLAEARLWFWTRDGAVHDVERNALLRFERPFERDFSPTPRSIWPDIGRAFEDNVARESVFFLALHGGSGENGTLQNRLETCGYAFTGSGSEASCAAFDKVRAKEALSAQGVCVADACLVDGDSATHEKLAHLFETHGKVVVKPVADGSSHGVRFIETEKDLDAVIVDIRRQGGAKVLAEAFITGRELTVAVYESPDGRTALPCSEVCLEEGRTFDYEGKYLGKGTLELTPAPVSDDVASAAQSVALTAHEALGCYGYSRTDIIIPGGPYRADRDAVFLELNTLPGLTAASFIPQQLEAARIEMDRFLARQIELALARSRR
ncbi:MAG: ATP-grasp domain-containing protein [Acidobacteria bacterium]|nr:MAG: ATP-grasp domain-containing protein [Acidobacteriota bacterium]